MRMIAVLIAVSLGPGPLMANVAAPMGDGDVTACDGHGLQWKRCSEGQAWQDGRCDGSALGHDREEALLVAAASRHARRADWRLPTLTELRRLRVGDAAPVADAAMFPDTPAMSAWTASAVAHGTDGGFVVHFVAGDSAYGVAVPAEKHAVRLVRTCTAAGETAVGQ